METKRNHQEGFTLLEILLVVAAIAILAGIVILALNPAKQLADTRDAQRWSDVNTILNAVWQYSIDNDGDLPTDVTTTMTEICANGGTCTGLVDLETDLVGSGETYLVAIPEDPTGSSTNGAGYEIQLTSGGRVTVDAPDAENDTIQVTR